MFDNYVVLILQLIVGIQSIQPSGRGVSLRRAAEYARAAAYHGQRQQVDPFELLALARNESDFNERTVSPDGLDCGVTQTRITYSRYSCAELIGSPWLAFAEAARELRAYAKSCRGHSDFDRCRLNRYNSGTRYARRGPHGRYYLRILCFAEAARRQLAIAPRCRSVVSEEQLALWTAPRTQPADRWDAPAAEALTSLLAQASPPGYGILRHEPTPPWQVRVHGVGAPVWERQGLAIAVGSGRSRVRMRRRGGRNARTSDGAPTRPADRSPSAAALQRGQRWRADRPGCA